MRTTWMLAAIVGLSVSSAAWAEGTNELDGPALAKDTVLFVDIVDSLDETIRFIGEGRITVFDSEDNTLGGFDSGEIITPTPGVDGPYRITLNTEQVTYWDVAVESSAGVETGRVYSYEWFFNSQTYSDENALYGSFYLLVPTGEAGENSVIELSMAGVVGWQWSVGVNGYGVDGGDGRSVPVFTYDFVPEYPVYLNPPALALYQAEDPLTGNLEVTIPDSDCDGVVPGEVEGEFMFTAEAAGHYHLTCDLNGDGVFDPTSDDDLTLSGEHEAGPNSVPWDGTDNGGNPVAAGTYECRVVTTIGEVHYVAGDIETAWPGIRLFELDAAGTRAGMPMFWNDAAVQANAVTMPDGQVSLESSGAQGVQSGSYTDEPVANDNARAWGDFTEFGKGNLAFLDTYTWLSEHASGTITVTVIDPTEDDCWDETADDTGPADTGPVTDTGEPVLAGYYHGGRLCATAPAAGGLAALIGLAFALGARRRDEE